MPKRIQRKRVKGWRKPDGVVDVTRGSKWGNPYKVIKRGDFWGVEIDKDLVRFFQDTQDEAAELAIELFVEYAEDRLLMEPDWLGPLRGKDVMCYCAIDAKCHGDEVIRLANR